MRITIAGTSALKETFSLKDPSSDEIRAFIRKGDARIAELASPVTTGDHYVSHGRNGVCENASPEALNAFLQFGFNFLGLAAEHMMDLGPDGLLETCSRLQAIGISAAGAGKELCAAERPVFFDVPGGRAALISVTTAFRDPERAGYQSRSLKGRPGVNGLRISTKVYVKDAHFKAIREIIAGTKMNGQREVSIRDGFTPKDPENTAVFGNLQFLPTEGEEEVRTFCSKKDLVRIGNAVKDALLVADHAVVLLHDPAGKAGDACLPKDAAVEFAHDMIDAGASALVGTGGNTLRGVEIYKGKPILYNIGKFISGENAEAALLPYLEFEGDTLKALQLKAIVPGAQPRALDPGKTPEVLNTLNRLSEPFGTRFSLRDGVISTLR